VSCAKIGQRNIVSSDLEVGLVNTGIKLGFQWYLDRITHGRWRRGGVFTQLIDGTYKKAIRVLGVEQEGIFLRRWNFLLEEF
jgi:hypothetical protein